MSRTGHGRALADVIERLPDEQVGALHRIARELARNEWPRNLVDACFQVWEARRPGLEEAYVVARVHSAICRGEMAIVEIDVGDEPSKDEHVERNDKVLKDALAAHGFGVQVWNEKHAECDGQVDCFEMPLTMWLGAYGSLEYRRLYEFSGYATLEIGLTQASRTLTHLEMGWGALARWPYKSKRLTVLANLRVPKRNILSGEVTHAQFGVAHEGPLLPTGTRKRRSSSRPTSDATNGPAGITSAQPAALQVENTGSAVPRLNTRVAETVGGR